MAQFLARVDPAFTIVANSLLIFSCHCSAILTKINDIYGLGKNIYWLAIWCGNSQKCTAAVKAVTFFSAGRLIDAISNNLGYSKDFCIGSVNK